MRQSSIVKKESFQQLSTIYPDEFIQNFILNLMELFVKFPPQNPTKHEQVLLDYVRNIEIANTLLWRLTLKINTNEEPSSQHTLHFTTQHDFQQIHLKFLAMQSEMYQQEVSNLVPDYPELDGSAHNITPEQTSTNIVATPSYGVFGTLLSYCQWILGAIFRWPFSNNASQNQQQNNTLSPLSQGINTLMTTTYTRPHLIQHIAHLNQKNIQDIKSRNTKMTLELEIVELEKKKEALKSEIEQLTLLKSNMQAESSNPTPIIQIVTNTDPQSLVNTDDHSSGESTESNGVTPTLQSFANADEQSNGEAVESGLFRENQYILKIQKQMDKGRWICITEVTKVLKETHEPTLKLSLIALLEGLLSFSSKQNCEDTIVEHWLTLNTNTCPTLEKALEQYKKLPCFILKEEKELETHYQCIAFCFSQGIFFPKLDDLREKFNNLRPSKQKSNATEGALKKKTSSRTLGVNVVPK